MLPIQKWKKNGNQREGAKSFGLSALKSFRPQTIYIFKPGFNTAYGEGCSLSDLMSCLLRQSNFSPPLPCGSPELQQIKLFCFPLSSMHHHLRSPGIPVPEAALISFYMISLSVNSIHEGVAWHRLIRQNGTRWRQQQTSA